MAVRLGATSCVLEADLPANVRAVAELVDDVELVLYDVPGHGCNFPDAATAAELRRLAERHDLTYTVHLPRDLAEGDDSSLDQARRAIDATRSLEPYAYVAHLDGTALMGTPGASEVAAWQAQADTVLRRVAEWVGEPRRLCLENVERWDPAHFAPVVAEVPVSRCIDVGHLWLEERDALAHLRAWLGRTRVVHLHGVHGPDHQSLAHVPLERSQPVVDCLSTTFSGVVTLEVFSLADLRESLAAWHGGGGSSAWAG